MIGPVALEDVLEAVPQLHGATAVDPLAGGLTNTNYKITTPDGCFVVRISGKDTGLLAIDRANEAHNTLAAAETGVGAPFVAAVPDHDALVLGFLEGEVMSPDKLQRGDIRVVQERGFRLPDRYLDFEPQVRALEQAMRVRTEATVPCNNDLLAENFIDVGGELR